MTKTEKSILEKALDEIKAKETECFREMAFLKEHNFEAERLAVSYQQGAYNDAWLILSSALDKLV